MVLVSTIQKVNWCELCFNLALMALYYAGYAIFDAKYESLIVEAGAEDNRNGVTKVTALVCLQQSLLSRHAHCPPIVCLRL